MRPNNCVMVVLPYGRPRIPIYICIRLPSAVVSLYEPSAKKVPARCRHRHKGRQNDGGSRRQVDRQAVHKVPMTASWWQQFRHQSCSWSASVTNTAQAAVARLVSLFCARWSSISVCPMESMRSEVAATTWTWPTAFSVALPRNCSQRFRAVSKCTFKSATRLFRVISSRALVILGCNNLMAILRESTCLRSSADIGG